MKALLACMAACISVGASAQMTAMNGIMTDPSNHIIPQGLEGRGTGVAETPTMRQQKLDRAIALRAEATALLAQDGGTLTPAHTAYLRRKACDILANQAKSGGLAPSGACRS
ncbi:hypothetical protein HL653_02340 [Sphingomonas sp. AP4-R1]|uniref:hypothetical protein n=1 Tax=Sphingomonas sp. AP4-R1 TaxID=2735134 RepID=UPI001493D9AF|nr:hypothetical protein [Sphingomonas sp. AP4-R1]QJU56780.1 hypothetical protein HL653_02340 [Sphingomonas sp. AP4-R1]